jgi:hypothetical protein
MKRTRRDLSCFYEAPHYVVVGLAFIVEVYFFLLCLVYGLALSLTMRDTMQ